MSLAYEVQITMGMYAMCFVSEPIATALFLPFIKSHCIPVVLVVELPITVALLWDHSTYAVVWLLRTSANAFLSLFI